MADLKTVAEVVRTLFRSPLANKPKPLPGESEAQLITSQIKIFNMALHDIENELLMAATVQHLTTEKWFPSIADLRQAAVGLINRADDVPDAYTAWGQVKKALQRGAGHYVTREDENGEMVKVERGIEGVHPLALKTIKALGGFKEYGMSPIDDEGQWRARFISAYQTYQKREADDAMTLPQIASYVEKRKELKGQSVKELVSGVANKLTMNGQG